MKPKKIPETIKNHVRYDIKQKKLLWIVTRGPKVRAGKEAKGCADWRGHVQVMIDGKFYMKSRVIYFLVYGVQPLMVYHKDKDRGNNIHTNLRAKTVNDGKFL